AVTGGNGNTTEETLASAPVVLLTEYQAHPENYDPATGFWILDDTADGNGWCYWSKLLPAGKATNLLLDNVTLDPENKPDDNYAYNIDVRLQAANKTEAYKLADKGDISDAAQELTHDLAADVIKTAPDGKLVKNISGNIWEELDDNGNSKTPRQFIYDGDGSIGKDKEYSGDELPCDRNGTMTLNNGTFAKATDNPHVFEEVNADGTPTTTPPTYLYTPTGDPNRSVGEGPMVTGQDGLFYIQIDTDTYVCTASGLVVTAPTGELPGGSGDILVSPQPAPIPLNQSTQFFASLQFGYPGMTRQIQVEFYNPADAGMQLRYISADPTKESVDQDGNVTCLSTISTSQTIPIAVIAPDGSYQIVNASSNTEAYVKDASTQALRFGATGRVSMNPSVARVLSAPALSPNGSGMNIRSYSYQITGNALGSTVTSGGLFTAGSTPGQVTVVVTANAVNDSSAEITLPDSTIVQPTDPYTFTGTIVVTIIGTPSAEATPFTTLTDLGVTSWNDVEPAPAYAGGNGTVNNPYRIMSIRQLKKFANDINRDGANAATYGKYFALGVDLDFTGADPVRDSYLLSDFQGTLDGQNHVIRGLNSAAGLFTNLTYGTIKNLGRVGGTVTGISGTTGFILGLGADSHLINCYNADPVSTTSGIVSGLVYYVMAGNATIDGCYNTGDVTGPGQAGGLIGYVKGDYNAPVLIKNSYNSGTISGANGNPIGGIIAYLHAGAINGQTVTLDTVKNYGRVIRTGTIGPLYAGDIIGYIYDPVAFTNLTLTNAQSLPNKIFDNAAIQPDKDIGNRGAYGASVTVNGQATFDLTGMP
ncbi:MAG: hypothetical protein FWD65_05770, partial [Coriobacteriia bacterium]|nr:hypothetical protein [Coriobacteriia bacterium]